MAIKFVGGIPVAEGKALLEQMSHRGRPEVNLLPNSVGNSLIRG